MNFNRRNFLTFLGVSLGGTLLGSRGKEDWMLFSDEAIAGTSPHYSSRAIEGLSFKPVKLPIPLTTERMTSQQEKLAYSSYEVKDDLILPEGYIYDVIGAWGDRLGNSRFGYNNDYLSYVETSPNEGFLTINFEYISGKTWMQTYPMVIGKSLPFEEVKAVAAKSQGKINAFALSNNDPLKAKIREISAEGLIDQGIGVMSLRHNPDGSWERTFSSSDRRISGISGLKDGKYLKSTGPAVAIFTKSNKEGYEDGLGDKIIGTFQNCAGGTTPWGTVLSAEENFQDQVPETVMADGSSLDPSQKPFIITDKEVDGRANVFGLAGNKYGWMVEVDPTNPNDYGTKHTWLGRFRHEAFGLKVIAGKQLAVYSGCDRRGGHLYKFVSTQKVSNPQSKDNSRLFEDGMLYGAKFNPDGTGRWIALNPNTPVDPVLPNQVVGKKNIGMVPLPNRDRSAGSIVKMTKDAQVIEYKKQFPTLGDLYKGDRTEQQGAILIDAHFAANAAGITCTARPEDTVVAPDGNLYITFTSGYPGSDGGPDKSVFQGQNGESPYEFGWIVSLREDNQEPAAMTFRWNILALGGEPCEGGFGFCNPDNLAIDSNDNIWLLTDISTSKNNKEITSRIENGKSVSQTQISGIFGNNSAWVIPTSGENAGTAYPFAIGPMETEMTGPCFSSDRKTLFLSIQHPGERNGMREDMAMEMRKFDMRTTQNKEFMQERQVPLGSNWPNKQVNQPPRPAVVAIRRTDSRIITA